MKTRTLKVLVVAFALALVGAVSVPAMAADVISSPPLSGDASDIDFANAISLDLPQVDVAPVADGDLLSFPGEPGFVPGRKGTGQMSPVRLPASAALAVEPQEFGSSNHPFTTSRVDLPGNSVSASYPYRIAGKLYFKIGTANYVCSASLIKRGVIVTAAHCVYEFGRNNSTGWHTNFVFVPALRLSGTTAIAPYGSWTGGTAWVMTSYYNGTDPCYVRGVVCRNDVAVITINPKTTNPTYPGTATGWYGYGWDGYGFTGTAVPGGIALFSQLGYPVSHDGGNMMQRTDSQAFVSASMAYNSVWGSRQTGGSSGGPELVNLGYWGTLSGTGYGSESAFNTVVGVTSWGYTSTTVKQQGCSPFLSTNIVPLVAAACAGNPPRCQ